MKTVSAGHKGWLLHAPGAWGCPAAAGQDLASQLLSPCPSQVNWGAAFGISQLPGDGPSQVKMFAHKWTPLSKAHGQAGQDWGAGDQHPTVSLGQVPTALDRAEMGTFWGKWCHW